MATRKLLLSLLLLMLYAAVSVGGRRRTFGRKVGLAPLAAGTASSASIRGTFRGPEVAASTRQTVRASRRRNRGPGSSLPPLRDNSVRGPQRPSSRTRPQTATNSLRRPSKPTTSFTGQPKPNRSQPRRKQQAAGRGRVRGSSSQAQRTTVQRPTDIRVPESPKRRFDTPAPDFRCPEKDGNFANNQQCDIYYVCLDGEAFQETCPDGLIFHPDRTYPCVYPSEGNCTSRQQAAVSTEQCPRQFATFKDPEAGADCGAYVRCVAGIAYPTQCPIGLAFDADTLSCQWADLVDQCDDIEGYVGFQCEQRTFAPEEVGDFTLSAHPSNCTQFYLCVNSGRGSVLPRLQSCPDTTVFDPVSGECTDQLDTVPACADAVNSQAVSAYQSRLQDEQERRESRLAELRAKFFS